MKPRKTLPGTQCERDINNWNNKTSGNVRTEHRNTSTVWHWQEQRLGLVHAQTGTPGMGQQSKTDRSKSNRNSTKKQTNKQKNKTQAHKKKIEQKEALQFVFLWYIFAVSLIVQCIPCPGIVLLSFDIGHPFFPFPILWTETISWSLSIH